MKIFRKITYVIYDNWNSNNNPSEEWGLSINYSDHNNDYYILHPRKLNIKYFEGSVTPQTHVFVFVSSVYPTKSSQW